ncbi:polysaccharide biosynthesis tyrosine autokinase [Bradyrhizobium sp.]|uniref:GumC family protein n=1 Tax=Bradyrhizobium sp. TaxID=376 RepID=UPI001EC5691E|nr:polysaccharide biosynthesis tyrosine autokinase [Bradyrhizobium sp.]MBV9979062.1 polysaccharide biosynthesis tyrosine autokinase [Bradyrhizobium sp.]
MPAGTMAGNALSMRAPVPFRLNDLLLLAHRRNPLILTVAAACVALAAVVLLLLPTLYSASAVVMLEQRKNNVAGVSAVLSELPTDPASVQNQIQILTSRDLASQVVDKLDLEHDSEFAGSGFHLFGGDAAADPVVQHERVVTKFLGRLSVENEGLSTALTITFKASTGEKAARIANAVAESYVQSQLDAKSMATREATDWLEGRVHELSREVQAADAGVERYKALHNLSDSANGTPLIEQQINTLSTQLVQAKADLSQKQATFSRVDTLARSGHGADISQAVASPLIIQLRSQEADLIRSEAELTTKYGPKHPKLIAVQSQKHDLEQKISDEVARLGGALSNDVSVAQAQVAALENSLANVERQAQAENLMRVKLKTLQVNAASAHSIYEAFVARLHTIQDQSMIEAPDAHIISHAAVPNAPNSPRRMLILAASIPIGLLLGLLAALLTERLGQGVPRQHAAQPPIPVLAELPGVSHPRAADLIVDWPTSPYALAIARLTSSILYGAQRGGPRTILVTSPQAGEGAPTVALSLARSAAAQGRRVVVVDANMAKPAVAPLVGYRAVRNGMAEVLAGRAPLSRALLKDTRSNVLLLSPSPVAGKMLGRLSSARMAQLIRHLARVSDLTIINAPPALGSTALQFLARQADAVMLVARADVNPRPDVMQAVEILARIPAPPIGMVLAA